MKLAFAALVTLGALGAPAHAQVPPSTPAPLAPFLEKRVPDELATEGLVLSRRNLSLQVEQVGDELLISLVDLQTGRVAASTKVSSLPADREAAVASLTHVVADLAAQAHPTAPADAVQHFESSLRDDEAAQYQYRRRAIRFGPELANTAIDGYQDLSRTWTAFQGDLGQDLPSLDFYHEIGRPDLAADYLHRQHLAHTGELVAGLGFAAAIATTVAMASRGTDGPTGWMIGLDVASIATFGVGSGIMVWYLVGRQPITESAAKTLADDYNQHLRAELGLPVASRASHRLESLQLSLAGPGLALSGQF